MTPPARGHPPSEDADPHRPIYHFLPPANWLNDPNGLIQWKGTYHLFYQYNPNGPFHGTIHWGHASSVDLVHWTDLPIALAPTPGGPDKDGCFSGCAVDADGIPVLIYTGVHPQVQCLATGDDELIAWRKHPANPIIAAPPPNLDVLGFRDPYVWRDGDAWYAVVGSGIQGVGGVVFLYRSADLIHWSYLGPLCSGRREETGEMWECPNFFPLGDRHVLILSPIPLGKAIYLIGTDAAGRFTPGTQGIFDDGGCSYAPQVMRDERGRRLVWSWLRERRSEAAQREAGWSGVMSLPAALTLRSDGTLGVSPVPELAALRGESWRRTDLTLGPGSANPLAEVDGEALEVAIEATLDDGAHLAIDLRCSPDDAERTRVGYDRTAGVLTVDRERSSQDPTVARDTARAPLPLAPDEPLRLRFFLDRSVLEVFANDRIVLTSRIYPTRADARGLVASAVGGAATIHSLEVWPIGSIWPAGRKEREPS